MVVTWSTRVRNLNFFKFFKNILPPHFFIFKLRPKKIKEKLSDWGVMMIVALWKKTIIAYTILPKNTKVDNVVYLDFLEHRLLPEVERKKLGVLLYYMIMPDHISITLLGNFFKLKDGRYSNTHPIALICAHQTWMV